MKETYICHSSVTCIEVAVYLPGDAGSSWSLPVHRRSGCLPTSTHDAAERRKRQ